MDQRIPTWRVVSHLSSAHSLGMLMITGGGFGGWHSRNITGQLPQPNSAQLRAAAATSSLLKQDCTEQGVLAKPNLSAFGNFS